MKPFEENLPEEQEAQAQEIITLLRQAYRREQRHTSYEQQEGMARAEARLTRLKEEPGEKVPGSFASRLQSKPARGQRTTRVLGMLAAILVVCALIGSAVLLFIRAQAGLTQKIVQPGPISAPIGPIGKPVVVNTQANGLKMSMSVTPGPYFLGELLAVTLTLTNQTHPTLTLTGEAGSREACIPSPLFTQQTGGTTPYYALYTIPVRFMYSCPAVSAQSPGNGPALVPGQTIVDHYYALLTSSGNVTLTGKASFYATKTSEQGDPGPLTGHLPELHIHVMPQIPANRVLSIQPEGSQVTIQAPAGIRLVDQTYILCEDSANHPWPGGYDYWKPLSGQTLQRPECSENGDTITLWKYAIGAEGYAVIQGERAN